MATEHFVRQDAEGPPVGGFPVSPPADDFRGEEFRGAAQGECASLWNAFRESEIGQLRVALCVQQKVLGLQVAVDDVLRVEVVQEEDQGGNVEAGDVRGELACLAEVREDLAAVGTECGQNTCGVWVRRRGASWLTSPPRANSMSR